MTLTEITEIVARSMDGITPSDEVLLAALKSINKSDKNTYSQVSCHG